jgi:hypothetical protein
MGRREGEGIGYIPRTNYPFHSRGWRRAVVDAAGPMLDTARVEGRLPVLGGTAVDLKW